MVYKNESTKASKVSNSNRVGCAFIEIEQGYELLFQSWEWPIFCLLVFFLLVLYLLCSSWLRIVICFMLSFIWLFCCCHLVFNVYDMEMCISFLQYIHGLAARGVHYIHRPGPTLQDVGFFLLPVSTNWLRFSDCLALLCFFSKCRALTIYLNILNCRSLGKKGLISVKLYSPACLYLLSW